MILQLNPPLPVYVTDGGTAMAHMVIDYGPEHHLIFVVFMDEDGECWCVQNPQIRGQWNMTMGRPKECESE